MKERDEQERPVEIPKGYDRQAEVDRARDATLRAAGKQDDRKTEGQKDRTTGGQTDRTTETRK